MSLEREILYASCKSDKIRNIVNMKGVEDYEPSYKGLKPREDGKYYCTNNYYEPSYKGYKAVPQGEQFFYVLTQKDPLQISQEAVSFLVAILTFATN